ncbi:uncharacterized protein N7503_002443 [Penicillium pulvis]|uniref:uncharacterized protein n=1 Tax=Penicillium pulvis TaxID=1562058 RepID=UPI002547FC45|nr:uncharacterized protein N7503_002443 [Penicillium pulvis]KAJ5810225.1 hypothetical protein N7503_002443 [Penicillium pulvis]
MSEPLGTAPLSDDATQDRSMIDNEHGPGTRHSSRRPQLRARPQSWHPYGPVEPPLEATSSRPIGVHSILNPPAQTKMEAGSRDLRSLSGTASPRPRKGSSPAPRSMHSLQQPLSPRSIARPGINPSSPSARFVGGGRSGQSSVAHSPLVSHEPQGMRQTPTSPPLPLDSALRPITSLPGTQPPVTASLQSTPNLHSHRTSAGPGPLTNHKSQETSPTTSHSAYGHFGRASPAITMASIPPSVAQYAAAPAPYMTMEAMARGVPATAGPRSLVEETGARVASPVPGTPGSTASIGGLIPCVMDLKSGSSSQAEKRKANSDASRRFRNRKRNEVQLEQRLTAQQDEIRRQSEEIRVLVHQRDHYRSERDFFREHLSRSGSLSSLPPRPPSPRSVPSASLLPAPTETAPSSRPQGWPGTPGPAPYASVPHGTAPGRDVAPSGPPVAGGPLPPFQGSWPRP